MSLTKPTLVPETTVATVVPAATTVTPAPVKPKHLDPAQPTLVETTAAAVTAATGGPWADAIEVATAIAPGTAVVEVTPTQVRRPWRSTARTIFQLALALATLLPFVASGVYADLDQAPYAVTQVLAAAGTFSRVMALPQVEAFLRQWVPWLAAAPATTPTRTDEAA